MCPFHRILTSAVIGSCLFRFVPHNRDQESSGLEDRPEAVLPPGADVWFLQQQRQPHPHRFW